MGIVGTSFTCDHHRRNLAISQSEFSIQRRSIGKMKSAAASRFGSKYNATAMIYKDGMPSNRSREEIISSTFPIEMLSFRVRGI